MVLEQENGQSDESVDVANTDGVPQKEVSEIRHRSAVLLRHSDSVTKIYDGTHPPWSPCHLVFTTRTLELF